MKISRYTTKKYLAVFAVRKLESDLFSGKQMAANFSNDLIINFLNFGTIIEISGQMNNMKLDFNLKTLLVDYDSFSLAMYQQHLLNMGCSNVKTFENELDCISNIENDTRVIFLDYRLDPANGLIVLQHIKTIRPDIYVVFIAGPSGTLEALYSLKYGAFEYIIKDEHYAVNLKKVLNKIQQIERMVYCRPGEKGTNYYRMSQ